MAASRPVGCFRRRCLYCILALFAAAGTASRADWPQFRGPGRDGLSADRKLLREWPKRGPRLAFSAGDCGDGFASVAIAGGKICTAGRFGREERVTALDLTGRTLWQTPNGESWNGAHPGARGTPTFYKGRVYQLSGKGRLVCLEAETGTEVWAVDTLEMFEAPTPAWGIAESVFAADGKIVCTPGGKDATVVAFNAVSGQVVWQMRGLDEATAYCSPVGFVFNGRKQLATMTAKSIIGIDFETGRLLWHVPHETEYDVNCATPVWHDGTLCVSTGYGVGTRLLRLGEGDGRIGVTEVWRNTTLDNHHGGIILVDGYVFGAGHRGNGERWSCLDAATGDTMYTALGVGKGAVTYADGLLFCVGEDGTVALVRADPFKYSPVSTFELPIKTKGPVWAHPVVSDRRLYIRHGPTLFVYDVAGE